MTVLKGIRKRLLSTAKILNCKMKCFFKIDKIQKSEKTGFLSKICGKNVFCGQQKFSFKTVILSLWSYFSVEALGRPQSTLLFNAPLITNLFQISSQLKEMFHLFKFQNSLVSRIFLQFDFLNVRQDVVLLF